ncbi:MAG: hypothetical protein ABI384_08560, partial [Allobranchiibius sp.]
MARPIPVTRDEVAKLGAGDQMRLGPAVQRLRMDLAAVDYATEAVGALLGDVASAALHREQLLPARRVAAADEPLAIVVRLFTLGVAVSVADIDRALPACGVAGLVELELVEPADADDDGDQLMRATCDLRPYGDE